MVWVNPTPVVDRFRQHLLDLPSLSAGGVLVVPEANIHYPTFSFMGADADELPAILIAEPIQVRSRWAEGAMGLPGGSVAAMIYVPWELAEGVGFVESLARLVQQELSTQFNGLPFRRIQTTLSSEPSEAFRAGPNPDEDDESRDGTTAYATIAVTCEYGLSRNV